MLKYHCVALLVPGGASLGSRLVRSCRNIENPIDKPFSTSATTMRGLISVIYENTPALSCPSQSVGAFPPNPVMPPGAAFRGGPPADIVAVLAAFAFFGKWSARAVF